MEAAPPRRLPKVGAKIPVELENKKNMIKHKVLKPLFDDIAWSLNHCAAFTVTNTYQAILDFTPDYTELH